MKTIAIVEDDVLLNEALCKTFENAGYHVKGAVSFNQGVSLLNDGTDLMVIDIGLPDGDGFALCRKAQEAHHVPVIFLTAHDEEQDMLNAFDCGADDYLVKPFPMSVLLRHAEAVLRRVSGEEPQIFCYEGLSIDFERKQVKCDGTAINLTPKEYRLLELLARNRKKVVTKRMMLEQIWDEDGSFVEENTVNVTLGRLKKKIEPDPSHPIYVKNVFGLGYTFGGE